MSSMTLISRVKNSFETYGVGGAVARASREFIEARQSSLARRRDHHGRASLHGAPKGLTVGIVVLAGYKPALWPLTLARIKRFAPPYAEVCVATPGKHVADLARMCNEYGWTYLTTAANKTGLALNKVIEAHSTVAQWFKLDEDIFIADGFFDDLRRGYDALTTEGSYRPGFCAPMLNVNGVSYAGFLESTGATTEYRKTFGEIRQASDGVRVHYDPKAAEWLWRLTLPFDKNAAQIRAASGPPRDSARLIGSRFSIGAIYFERSLWEAIGGFASTWRQGVLGVDETALCTACMLASRPMFYMTNVLAGHFSFYPQERAMMDLLPELTAIDPLCFPDNAGKQA